MRITPTLLLAQLAILLALVLAPLSAAAQEPTVLAPGASVTVAWDAPAVDASGANAPTGYRFETFADTDAGVVITTTDVPLTPTTATLPATVLPTSGAFLLAVRAFNASGASDRSNALPFVRPVAPGVPGSLRIVTAP